MSIADSSPVPTPKRVKIEGVPNLWQNCRTGRYEDIRVYPGSGKQRLVTLNARTLTEAKREQRALAVQVDRGEVVEPSRVTFAEAWQDFERTFESLVSTGEKSERTLELYRQRWRTHLEPRLGRLPVQKIGAQHIAALFADLRKSGLSPWTLQGVWTLLGSIFTHAQTRALVTESPLKRIAKSERPRGKSKKRPRALTDDECRALIDNTTGVWRALIATAVFSGCRLSELLAIRWQDVDFDTETLRVRFQLTIAKKDKPARLAPLKTGAGERDVYLLPEVVTLLRKHKLASSHSRDDSYAFCTRAGGPLTQRNAGRAISNAAERAGIEATMHDLRHTAISRLIAAGLDVVQVQRQAGHARPSVTLDIYSHEFERAKRSEDVRAKIAATGIGAVLEGRQP